MKKKENHRRVRRGRNEGSLYQRGDGLWVASASGGRKADGSRNRLVAYGKTKGEAQAKLAGLVAKATGSPEPAREPITVSTYLKRWLETIRPTVARNSHAAFTNLVKNHLTPTLGGKRLDDLRRADVKAMYATLGQKGVSVALQRMIGTCLSVALNQAVADGLVAFNAALGVKKPRPVAPEIHPLTKEQVKVFLTAAKGNRLYPYFVTAIDSGAGPGELFALRWPDVDLDAGYLLVNKSLEDAGGKLRTKDTKTARRRRRIDLAASTVAVLREHKAAMAAEGHLGGPVFCTRRGGYLRVGRVRVKVFQALLKKAGLPHFRLYDLRHTCATLLLLADVNPKIVSERLGHASITRTLDTYSHVLPTMGRAAADKMGEFLRDA